jgi:hypothetical protein
VGLLQQVAGTLLFGLPSLLGSRSACPGCPTWPSPSVAPSPIQALPVIAIGGAYSGLMLLGFWTVGRPLAREALPYLRRAAERGSVVIGLTAPTPPVGQVGGGSAELRVVPLGRDERARRWGRALLVIGGGFALVVYLASRASYVNVDTAPRYITDLLLCVPLMVVPLVRAAGRLRRWCDAARRGSGRRRFPGRGALLGSAALLALLAVDGVGATHAILETGDRQIYGVPAGTRDTQLLSFLYAHGASDFYTSWWVCYRLMFDSAERATCYVVSDTDPFAPGSFNRVPAYAEQVVASPHPAYVFDLTTTEVAPGVPAQVAARIAAHDPRFVGYNSTTIGSYVIFYFAGSARH